MVLKDVYAQATMDPVVLNSTSGRRTAWPLRTHLIPVTPMVLKDAREHLVGLATKDTMEFVIKTAVTSTRGDWGTTSSTDQGLSLFSTQQNPSLLSLSS